MSANGERPQFEVFLAMFFDDETIGLHELNDETKAFVDKYQTWLSDHEENVHDGQRCDVERASLVAFIIHRLGFNARTWDTLLPIVEWYEEQHAMHAQTCACGQWPIEEYGPRCPSCPTEEHS